MLLLITLASCSRAAVLAVVRLGSSVARRHCVLVTESEATGHNGAGGTQVFMNSLVFEGELMRAMERRLRALRSGAVVLTTQLMVAPAEKESEEEPGQGAGCCCWELLGDSDACFELFDTAALTEPTVYVQRRL